MEETMRAAATSEDRVGDRRIWLLLLSAGVFAVDYATKRMINFYIPAGVPIPLIPGVLRLTHVLNTGAAFSMFEGSNSPHAVRYGLIGFSVIAAGIVFAMLWRVGRTISLGSVALALILGGALGNLYDRVVYRHVIDFIEVRIVHYHWPDFNVADSAICIGAGLLVLEIFRPQPKEDVL